MFLLVGREESNGGWLTEQAQLGEGKVTSCDGRRVGTCWAAVVVWCSVEVGWKVAVERRWG